MKSLQTGFPPLKKQTSREKTTKQQPSNRTRTAETAWTRAAAGVAWPSPRSRARGGQLSRGPTKCAVRPATEASSVLPTPTPTLPRSPLSPPPAPGCPARQPWEELPGGQWHPDLALSRTSPGPVLLCSGHREKGEPAGAQGSPDAWAGAQSRTAPPGPGDSRGEQPGSVEAAGGQRLERTCGASSPQEHF